MTGDITTIPIEVEDTVGGVPGEDPIPHFRVHRGLRNWLAQYPEVVGIRLIKSSSGWGNPRGGERTTLAYGIYIKTPESGKEYVQLGPFGRTFTLFSVGWDVVQTTQFWWVDKGGQLAALSCSCRSPT